MSTCLTNGLSKIILALCVNTILHKESIIISIIWKDFLDPSIILDQFSSSAEYGEFVKESDIKNEVEDSYLLDNVSDT